MCGISGIINKNNQKVEDFLIKQMNDSIHHRGPDGEGFYFGDNFALGHRRLSIIDLSEDANQPMEYNSRYFISYNGEIYNYLELREELISLGCSFKTKSDTEVVLAAYSYWGGHCVQRFNGMWSFAIYDKEKDVLFISRDRFGVKPFYYFVNEEVFAFGSEIKQLLPFLSSVKVNRQVLLDYLIAGFEENSNSTFFESIEKLEQGNNLIYNLRTHHYSTTPYYILSKKENIGNVSEEQSAELYKNQLMDAVKLRMRSDVEVGVCLSGGLDSSSITAISANIIKDDGLKIKAIHGKSTEKEIDESGYAKEVADHTLSEFITIQPSYENFASYVSEVIKAQEEPFGSPSIILQYFVLKEARKQHCLVMLDGQGGDETLLGYERYYPAFLLQKKGISMLKEFIHSSRNSKLTKVQLLKYILYFTNYKSRLSRLRKRNKHIKKSIIQSYESPIMKELSQSYSSIYKLQQLEISKTQLPHLLRYEDKNSMVNSVEARLPFLDYRCVELAISLPDRHKIKGGWTKYILRKGIEPLLPKNVTWRKDKLGFNAPEKTWISQHKQPMIDTIANSELLGKIIEKESFDFNNLDRRTQWRLFNIAKWEETFEVKW